MKLFFIFLLLFSNDKIFSQADTTELLFAFRINEYKVALNDTTTVVQVLLPDASPVIIKEKQLGVLKHRYESGTTYDTSLVGWGRCQLIKGQYYYFAIHHEKGIEPEQGNLLYTKIKVPLHYNGLLLGIGAHAVSLTKVDETQFYYAIDIFSMNKDRENEILDSMVADIQFTGKMMQQQSDSQDQTITGGMYDGKKLFVAMQMVKRDELIEFLKFIIARPGKYAGNLWKISETFATWMINATPQVVKN